MSVPRISRVGIVGAGRGGSALLDLFANAAHVTVAIVVDLDPRAPGLQQAQACGIPTATDLRTVFAHAVDVVIEVTGRPEVQAELLRLKPPEVEILGAASARLMWEILEKRQQTLAEVSALHSVTKAVAQSLDLAEVQEAALVAAIEATQTRTGVIRLLDEETGEFVITAHRGVSKSFIQRFERLPLRESLVARAVQEGEVVVARIEDFPEANPVRTALEDEGILVFASTPLRSRDRVVGFLAVSDPPASTFPPSQLILLQAMGQQIGLAIDNARVHDRLTQAFKELKATQEQLVWSERLTALGEMAAGVAHDFNNRLAVILGRTQLVLGKTDDPDIIRDLMLIEQSAVDSAETVRRVLEFTRRRRDQPSSPVHLTALVEEVVEGTRGRWKDEAQALGLIISLETALEPVPPVLGHAPELREVLTNLIFNSIEAMPLGGRIVLRTRSAGNQVQIEVEDTGLGMPEAIRARAFEPFFTTKSKGAGLGLSVAYGIILRHGGQIQVASREGRGTTVRILLPAASEAPSAPSPPSDAPRAGPPARILVIDDEEPVLLALTEMLTTGSHLVTGAGSGPEGLAILETTHFDLVFTDLGMPGMNGWEVAKRVRTLRPETPVVLITGWGPAVDPNELQKKGVERVLFKPFRMEELLGTVQALVKGSGR
jgi:signal transduction histidine kinase